MGISLESQGLVEQWLTYLTNANLSPNTIATYRRTLTNLPDASTASREDVEAWWDSRTHLSVATRVNELSAVRQFYKWCRIWEHRTDDPTLRIRAPKSARGLPHPISRADLTKLLDKLDGEMRRAICLGAYGGLRVSEAAALDWAHIDLETNRLRITGKGGKTRLVGLPSLLLDSILPDTGLNVVTGTSKTYTAGTLQRKVNRAIQASGADATYHALRHRFATVALGSTGNLLAVSRALGHSSVATTAIYAATADTDLDLIAAAVTR